MIYLAEKRGCTQTQVHRSFHSFNFGTYQLAHREPFGALRVFNDEALMPGASITYSLTDDHLLLLLPIAGGAFARVVTQAGELEDALISALDAVRRERRCAVLDVKLPPV